MPKPSESLSRQDQRTLLQLAHRVVAHGCESSTPLTVDASEFAPALQEQRAAFVSHYVDDNLRGCTGEIRARRSLVEAVTYHAYSAAFLDDRFPPIQQHELARLKVTICVLEPPEPITFSDEQDLLTQLRPNIDGLIIESGSRSATFLPQVWASLPSPQTFLDQLKQKAGLAQRAIPGLRAWRYAAEEFHDSDA